MKKSASLVVLGALVSLSACVSAPSTPIGGTPSPSIAPSAAPSAAASSAPAAPSATPSVTPSAPVAGSFNWSAGQLLKSYQFNRVDGIHFNPYLNQLFVVDAVDDVVTTREQLLRKFQPDGTYMATITLERENEAPPVAIDAMTFDASGTPLYFHRKTDDSVSLRKLLTSTVTLADRYPVGGADWAGVGALLSKGQFLSLGLLSLDTEKRDAAGRSGTTPDVTGGKVYFAVAEEDEPAQVLFQVPDPFVPTRAMAFANSGDLYLAGQTPEGGFGLKRLKSDQSIVDVGPLSGRPFGMWTGPEGSVYIVHQEPGAAARMRHVEPDGRLGAEVELKLAGGGFLDDVKGLTFNREGLPLLTGSGFDAASRRVSGIYTFPR